MSGNINNTRVIAIAGHSGAGKTSIIEDILYRTHVTTRRCRIDDDTSFCNYLDDERKRKTTINSKLLTIPFQDKKIYLMDTPGYADFYGDTVSALTVSDGMVIVLDAVAGLQVGSRKAWQEAERLKKPRAFFINKLDKDQVFLDRVVASLQESYGKKCVMLTMPLGSRQTLRGVVSLLDPTAAKDLSEDESLALSLYRTGLSEAAADTDDVLLEKYLGGTELSQEELVRALRRGFVAGSLCPILCGSAEKGIGINEMLDLFVTLFPSPLDAGLFADIDGRDVVPDPDAPFKGLVFKTVTDAFIGQLTYIRVYQGTLKENSEVFDETKNNREKIGHLYSMNAHEQKLVHEAVVGDIVAVPKIHVAVGDTIGAPGTKGRLMTIAFPSPAIAFSIHAKEKGVEEKIATGLHKLCEDDPTLHLEKNVETKEIVLSGLGDVHIEVALARLKEKFHVDVEIGKPKIAYKETCRRRAEGHDKHKKQTGGHGQYGEVYLKIEPRQHGSGFEYVDEVVGGAIPRNFIPAVEKGVVSAMQDGVLARYPVVDVKVTVYDGSYHVVDSSEMSFKMAGQKAFRDAFMKADPVLLEPIMDVEVAIPDAYTGTVMGDLNGKRGRVLGMDMLAGLQVIKAKVPIAEMFSYMNELRSMTGGQGSFTMNFSHYEEVPSSIMRKVVEESHVAPQELIHA